MLKGITVTLYERTQTGIDAAYRPVYEEAPVPVENVLVVPLSEQEMFETLSLTGRKAVYQLGLPKGDAHEWENRRVDFFGHKWRVIGKPVEGIEAMIPLEWNTKLRVESMENEDG